MYVRFRAFLLGKCAVVALFTQLIGLMKLIEALVHPTATSTRIVGEKIELMAYVTVAAPALAFQCENKFTWKIDTLELMNRKFLTMQENGLHVRPYGSRSIGEELGQHPIPCPPCSGFRLSFWRVAVDHYATDRRPT